MNFIDGNTELWPPTVKGSRDYIEKVLVQAAPTALARFLESLLFIVYVFKYGRAALDTGQSLYYRGLANLNLQRLGIRKQAQPIAMHVIATMEAVIMSGSHSILVRVVMGGLLCLVYFRARAGDMSEILSFVIYNTFIECSTRDAKTSSKDRLQTTLLAPRVTVSGLDWWPVFVDLRNFLGIPLEGGALFPSLTSDDQWVNVQSVMSDIIALIRMVATIAGADNAQLLGTHSGKVTMLAAAVLFGILKEVRARLGYHKVAGDRSINSYARELLYEPVQQMAGR